MRYRRSKHWLCAFVAVAVIAATSAPAFAIDSAIVRSILFPGAGQAQNGHYTKAALFATAAVITAAGLLVTDVNYDRSVEDLDNLKAQYAGYVADFQAGRLVLQSDLSDTYTAMEDALKTADDRRTWRNTFLVALLATYTLNLVDVIMSKPDTGEIEDASSLSIEMRGADVMVVKSFSF